MNMAKPEVPVKVLSGSNEATPFANMWCAPWFKLDEVGPATTRQDIGDSAFVLNDVIVKDNRIPPEGFNNARFKEHLSEPVGATYQDGQYWDDIEYDLPEKCVKIEARLLYQSASWEYIKFLAEENRTDDWGKRLYEAWKQTGQCEPVVMASVKKEI